MNGSFNMLNLVIVQIMYCFLAVIENSHSCTGRDKYTRLSYVNTFIIIHNTQKQRKYKAEIYCII